MKKKIASVLTSLLVSATLLTTLYFTIPATSPNPSPEGVYHWKIMLAQKGCNAWIEGNLTIGGEVIPGTNFSLACICELPESQPLGQFVFWKAPTDVIPNGIHFVKYIDLDKDDIPDIVEPIDEVIPGPIWPEEPHTWYQHNQTGIGPYGPWMVVVEVREQPYDPDFPWFQWQLTIKQHNLTANWSGNLTKNGTSIPGTDFDIHCEEGLNCTVVRTPYCTVPNDIHSELLINGTPPPVTIEEDITQFPWTYVFAIAPGVNATLELTEIQSHKYWVMGGWKNTASGWGAPTPGPGWNLSGWMYGEGFPFATRAPYLAPLTMRQNITFTQRDPITGIVELSVPAESYVGLDHIFYASDAQVWIRVQIFLEQQGCGWLFTGEGKEPVLGSVDLLTFNNYSGVYTFGPDQTAKTADDELLAGEVWNGTHYSGSAGAGPPIGPCLQLLRGSDGIPGTYDDPIGRGDPDGPNPPGTSILYLPTRMNATTWDPYSESWEELWSIPWPQLMTTGTANDTVIEPLSPIDGTNSTRTGQPWEYYAGLDHSDQQVPWKDSKCNAYVHYVTVWSMLNVFTNIGYMDILFEVEEKKVREDCVIADINCDEIVDFKDLYLVARAFGSRDEGIGPDGIPETPDDKPVADSNYDARCDVKPDGKIDLIDVVRIALDYDFIPGYHVPDSWQGTISVVPSSTVANVGQKFEVNITVSDVTDLYLALFCIRWNPDVLDLTKDPTPGDFLPGETQHVYARINHTEGCIEAYTGTIMGSGPGASGSGTVATLEFEVVGGGSSPLDLYNCSWMDSTTGQYGFETVQDGSFNTPCVFPVSWKWLNSTKDPVWLTANVAIPGCCQAVQNFSFNRSLRQISFNVTSGTPGFCNVTVPKLLMDGAFKVLIDGVQVPSTLTWNSSHTFIYFPYSQGTHNVKIIGEIVTRIRTDLFIADVNGDGKVTITDIVIVALRFGWEEDC